ncbi:histidine phosphatase family protein [Chloroflexota bacterium]
MTEIILVRHGETEWNREGVFRGRIDIELNEIGLKQAELLAEYLSELEIEAIYSSPVERAVKTASAIAQYHRLNVETAPGLIDLDFGEWQGLSRQKVKEQYKEIFTNWMENPHLGRVPGGESLDEVRERAMAMVNDVINKHDGTIVLVSHRVVNKVLICALLGLDNSHFRNIKLDTCGITTFSHKDGEFILEKHNDTSFLKALGNVPLGDF